MQRVSMYLSKMGSICSVSACTLVPKNRTTKMHVEKVMSKQYHSLTPAPLGREPRRIVIRPTVNA
jgi:hypothetical protein